MLRGKKINMNKISLHAEGISDVTIIPNTFIDQFMPSANGAYVKVYLYLLRCFSGNCPDVTISSIADCLENTEKDIIRALSYWEKLNLITLSRNIQKEITAIHLVDITNMKTESNTNTYPDTELDEIAVSIHTGTKPASRQNYSPEKVAQLTNNDEIKWAMHIVEIYLDRPLKPMDLQLILYLYEELHFSAELIMYLYEYCVSKGKKSSSYIEAVALTWAEEGIDTEEKAKEATATYNDHFNTVGKAFGLNRSPGQIERQYIKKWVEVFGFSDEIITEACNRTILRTQKPDFKYTDKILETWFKKGVKGHTDIARIDEEFSKANKATEANKPASTGRPPAANKFNQFPQRTYTAQDYAELERKLLNKGL
jgi:DnaD/phage-associated family protein